MPPSGDRPPPDRPPLIDRRHHYCRRSYCRRSKWSPRTLPSGHSKFDPGESRQQCSRHPHCHNPNKTRPLFPSIRQFATDPLANGTIWVLSDFATVITALPHNPPVSASALRRRPRGDP